MGGEGGGLARARRARAEGSARHRGGIIIVVEHDENIALLACWAFSPRSPWASTDRLVLASITLIDANTNLSVLAHGERVPLVQIASKAHFLRCLTTMKIPTSMAFWVLGRGDR